MATIGANNHPRKARWLLSAGILLLVAAAVLSWLRFAAPAARPFVVPGSQDSASFAAFLDAEDAKILSNRLNTNLMTRSGLVSWYQQAQEELGIPAQWSHELTAQDQLLYGSWLAEQGEQRAFALWNEQFRASFISPDGLVFAKRTLTPGSVPETLTDLGSAVELQPAADERVSWSDSLHYFRVLALAYANWPQDELDLQEKALASSLARVIGTNLEPDQVVAIPTSAPTQDPAATPTPRPLETDEATGAGFASDPVLRLASLDLLALHALAKLDPDMETRSAEAVALVRGGLISDALPLYAYGFTTQQQGYVRFVSTAPVVDLADSLTCTLHLAEIGELDPRTLSWLVEHLLNDNVLYASYHIAQGQASTSQESLAGLALTARIARIANHEQLYRKAVERLQWHRATSPTSSVLNAVFHQDSQGIVTMTARDNLLALLAMS